MSDLTRLARDLRPLILRARGARVYNSANQSISNITSTALTFDSERWDDEGFHSTSSNTSRLTIPTPGRYQFGGYIRYAANATGHRRIAVQLNGSTFIASDIRPTVTTASIPAVLSISGIYEFAAGDYIELMAYQDSGGALNAEVTGNYGNEFYIYGPL